MQHLTRQDTYKHIIITRTTWQDSCQAGPAGGKHTHTILQNIKDKTDGRKKKKRKHYKALANISIVNQWTGKSNRIEAKE